MNRKKIDIYFPKYHGSTSRFTLYRVKPKNHPLLFQFITTNLEEIINGYNTAEQKAKIEGTKNRTVLSYTFENSMFELLRLELGLKGDSKQIDSICLYKGLSSPMLILKRGKVGELLPDKRVQE